MASSRQHPIRLSVGVYVEFAPVLAFLESCARVQCCCAVSTSVAGGFFVRSCVRQQVMLAVASSCLYCNAAAGVCGALSPSMFACRAFAVAAQPPVTHSPVPRPCQILRTLPSYTYATELVVTLQPTAQQLAPYKRNRHKRVRDFGHRHNKNHRTQSRHYRKRFERAVSHTAVLMV